MNSTSENSVKPIFSTCLATSFTASSRSTMTTTES